MPKPWGLPLETGLLPVHGDSSDPIYKLSRKILFLFWNKTISWSPSEEVRKKIVFLDVRSHGSRTVLRFCSFFDRPLTVVVFLAGRCLRSQIVDSYLSEFQNIALDKFASNGLGCGFLTATMRKKSSDLGMRKSPYMMDHG